MKFKIFTKNNKKRKMFIVGKKEKQITSAGIIFYKDDNILLINNKDRNMYEDFGGKVELGDANIMETAAREAEEESNGIFNYNYLLNKLNNKKFIYIDHSKYAVFFIPVKQKIDIDKFGKKEEYCGVNRTVEWINYSNLKKINIMYRLRHKYLFKILSKILKNK